MSLLWKEPVYLPKICVNISFLEMCGANWGYDCCQIKGLWACLWLILLKPDLWYTLLVGMCSLAIPVPGVPLNTIAICPCAIGDLLPSYPLNYQSLVKISVWKPVWKQVERGVWWLRGGGWEQRTRLCQSCGLEEVIGGERTVEDYSTATGWSVWAFGNTQVLAFKYRSHAHK